MSDEYSKPPYNKQTGIPDGYTWSDMNTLKGAELEAQYKKTLELLYKLTVEMSVMMNILAVTNDVNYATIQKLRHDCILAMKEAYAKYPFDIVLAWQSGKE